MISYGIQKSRNFVLVAVVMLIAGFGPVTGAYAKSCKDNHFHNGYSGEVKGKKAAERAALKGWASFTAWEYGSSWASWRNASKRKMKCDRLGAKVWHCFASAIPCKK